MNDKNKKAEISNDQKACKSQKEKEYEHLVRYEIELFKNRWTVFTALMSISFVLTGLGLKEFASNDKYLLLLVTCFLSAFVAFIALFHYLYFHGLAHRIRHRGLILERDLRCKIFEIRKDHKDFKIKDGVKKKRRREFHFLIKAFTYAYMFILVLIMIVCLYLQFKTPVNADLQDQTRQTNSVDQLERDLLR